LRGDLCIEEKQRTQRYFGIDFRVTLLVGIQITTDTLKNSFLTSLLQREGEVDLQIANSTTGAYLKASDNQSIAALLPDAVGVMPELTAKIPALVRSQFDPKMTAAGIPTDYPDAFGAFTTGNQETKWISTLY